MSQGAAMGDDRPLAGDGYVLRYGSLTSMRRGIDAALKRHGADRKSWRDASEKRRAFDSAKKNKKNR